MRIASFRPEPPDDLPGPKILAWFDIHPSPEIRINHLMLRRNATGQLSAYPARVRGSKLASFAPSINSEITEAAIAAYQTFLKGGHVPDARTCTDA